jgi:hypothetical protein
LLALLLLLPTLPMLTLLLLLLLLNCRCACSYNMVFLSSDNYGSDYVGSGMMFDTSNLDMLAQVGCFSGFRFQCPVCV